MRSVFTCTTLAIIVPLVFSQRPLAHYPENLKRAVPHHYKNDQENTHRGLDKIARWHKIEPPLPRLRPHQTVPWLRWVQGRWAAPADKNTELHKVRAHLLEEKLKPNHLVFKPHINPQLKPKLNKKENVRTKREVGKTEKETPQKETDVEVNVRHKRDLMMPQLVPEMVLQPHIQANIPQPRDQLEGEIKESEKREKRQILYFINRPPKLLARSPRTTPNPFIRDTHIEEYDIIRPEVGEREGMIPTIESGSSDLGSYPLVSETSDLEYESDYTISMSDSEEWHNYPLTTPSGPNPGWQLSTLADIYQKQKRSQNHIFTHKKARSNINTIIQVWRENGDQAHNRMKRSPKERKRKIGAYKEKIKQRRKVKDMKRKRRIIRNSKEDKAVKEYLKDDNAIERLLQRPRVFPRQTAYQVEETSREILWSNGTHNIVEDKEAYVKWINETHYVIYKNKENSTDEWYNQHHVLCYNDEWENKTSEEKRNATIGEEYEDEEADHSVVKVDEKKKSSGKAAAKKKTGKKKGKKGEAEKKAPKPKRKLKQSKKIKTVKNVDEEPKDPRRDPREKKVVKKSMVSSEEIVVKKKDKKKDKDVETDTSEIKKKKKKRERISKKESDKDDSSKIRKSKKSEINDSDEKESTRDKRDKTTRDSHRKDDPKRKMKTEKETKRDKKKKMVKTEKSDQADVKKRKKEKKTNDISTNTDTEKSRKKRSIYHSDESKTTEVRWEKVQKSEYDGWTVFGGQEDKSVVYDASYELIETRNITKKPH